MWKQQKNKKLFIHLDYFNFLKYQFFIDENFFICDSIDLNMIDIHFCFRTRTIDVVPWRIFSVIFCFSSWAKWTLKSLLIRKQKLCHLSIQSAPRNSYSRDKQISISVRHLMAKSVFNRKQTFHFALFLFH